MGSWFPWVVVLLALALAVIMPKLLRLRLRVLKWMHWTWAVNLLEEHFDFWVLFGRVMLLVVAVVVALIAFSS